MININVEANHPLFFIHIYINIFRHAFLFNNHKNIKKVYKKYLEGYYIIYLFIYQI